MNADHEPLVLDAIASNSPDLLAFFERRLQAADAADALAETMIAAWRRADSLPADAEHARMWLFVIARNVLHNTARGERRRWRLANTLRLLVSQPGQPAADEGLAVRDAVNRLEPHLAELIRLVHWDGFSITAAADILEITPSTARGRYQRAKTLLRESLHPLDQYAAARVR